MQKSDIKKGAKGQRELQQKEEEQKVEQRMRREWLKGKWEELREEEEEEVKPREKWEELKVEEELEQRVTKEEDLKEEEEGEESRGLVSQRSATREVEPTTTEGLWLTGREIEEWLDHQLDTERGWTVIHPSLNC